MGKAKLYPQAQVNSHVQDQGDNPHHLMSTCIIAIHYMLCAIKKACLLKAV